jgi:hypothetical protein
MRRMVINEIKLGLSHGLDEMGQGLLTYRREKTGNDKLLGTRKDDKGYIRVDDINEYLNCLSDEELLIVLDSQACQRYR